MLVGVLCHAWFSRLSALGQMRPGLGHRRALAGRIGAGLCAVAGKSYRSRAQFTTNGACMPAIRLSASTAAALAILAMGSPATAATCADQPVTARGDPSRFEVLAKAKARGNWRAKVRALPALGAAFADWNKALAADYRCSQKDAQHTCVAVAYPCRD
jgi:hypothetical protein